MFRPDAQVRAHLGSRDVARVVYGSIIGLALVVVLEAHPPGDIEAAATILGAALAVGFAELYSETIATGTRERHRHRVRLADAKPLLGETGAVVFGAGFPALFLLAAVAGLIEEETAYRLAKWTGLALIAAYGFAGAKLAGAGHGRALVDAVLVGAIGAFLIVLKALLHRETVGTLTGTALLSSGPRGFYVRAGPPGGRCSGCKRPSDPRTEVFEVMSATAFPPIPHHRSSTSEDEGDGAGRIGRFVPFALLTMALALAAACVIVAISSLNSDATAEQPAGGHGPHAAAAAPAIPADDKSVKFEEFKPVSPDLPAIPEGEVKKFKVDVFEHVTKVAEDKPALNVWSYGINGEYYRGTGASTPMVVTQGDKVEIELINGSNDKMTVQFPHSIDYHSSEIAPNKAFSTIEPGKTKKFEFVAKHPGVFMYHCATDPVLLHTGAGMVGMMIVKPRDLAPVDRELWITQQEFYFGEKAGANPSVEKMQAKQPDVITFNGYANQYAKHPIQVKKGETVRMYVMNAGPSIWSAFHVIGTVFDRTVIEGTVGHSAQTVNLAPSQGGWVEFTLDDEGNFPFVTHAFGDMVKGAQGVLQTEHSTAKGMGH